MQAECGDQPRASALVEWATQHSGAPRRPRWHQESVKSSPPLAPSDRLLKQVLCQQDRLVEHAQTGSSRHPQERANAAAPANSANRLGPCSPLSSTSRCPGSAWAATRLSLHVVQGKGKTPWRFLGGRTGRAGGIRSKDGKAAEGSAASGAHTSSVRRKTGEASMAIREAGRVYSGVGWAACAGGPGSPFICC